MENKERDNEEGLTLLPFFSSAEQAKAKSAQAAVKILEEMEEKHMQMMKEKERCHQERVRQLTEKMEQERTQIVEEQGRILALKIQVFSCVTSASSSTVLNQKHSIGLNITGFFFF